MHSFPFRRNALALLVILCGMGLGSLNHGTAQAQTNTPVPPPPLSTFPQSAQDWLNNGLKAIEANQLPAAIEAFQTALTLDPQLVPAHYNLGLALRQSGDLPGAIAAFTQTTQLDPRFALAYSNLGAALLENNNLEQAQAVLMQAIQLDPQLSIAQYNLGLVYERAEAWPQAAAAFVRTLQLQTNSPQAFYHLGIVLQQQAAQVTDPQGIQRLLNQAQSAYLQAIFLDPQYLEALYRLGSLNYDQENYLAAIGHFRRAAEVNPNYPDAYYAAALAFVKLNQPTDALTLFSHALTLYQSQNRRDWAERTQQQIDRLKTSLNTQ
ncbi:MAG: tetratricopeptide repeat protein [Prochlorotrichaceae cyanobacterium]